MTAFRWERDEWNRAHDTASDPDPLDPSAALGMNDPAPTQPPHVCWQDRDPWCETCGPELREWMRAEMGRAS